MSSETGDAHAPSSSKGRPESSASMAAASDMGDLSRAQAKNVFPSHHARSQSLILPSLAESGPPPPLPRPFGFSTSYTTPPRFRSITASATVPTVSSLYSSTETNPISNPIGTVASGTSASASASNGTNSLGWAAPQGSSSSSSLETAFATELSATLNTTFPSGSLDASNKVLYSSQLPMASTPAKEASPEITSLRKENADLRQMVDSLISKLAAMAEIHREQANTSVNADADPDASSPINVRLAAGSESSRWAPRNAPPSPTDRVPSALHAQLMRRGTAFQPLGPPPGLEPTTVSPLPRTAPATPMVAGDRWGALRPDADASGSSLTSRRLRASPILRNGSVETLVQHVLDSRVSQDASIALQQQLKQSDQARTEAIIDAMRPLLLPLAHDKHGNFLVQRAISVRPELVWEMRGKFVELALSQFGCHVVHRMLEEPEHVKQAIVEELLQHRLMETLTARTAVHIWQKALEIRWTNTAMRTRLFRELNATLRGKWHSFVMQETGSIICQNMFESADADEKEECIQELLQHVAECAENQWGVWVVQHLIDHGDQAHRHAVFARLLESAVQLTLSQHGQKAMMTALKTNDPAFMVPYVDLLCRRDESSQSALSKSRRSVLIDIACTPQGFNIVTQLLTNVDAEQRERLIATVRRNSVFLKGSKAGVKVHTLCERARAFSGY